jgi:LysR family carnitine catabolism transcriptional activator
MELRQIQHAVVVDDESGFAPVTEHLFLAQPPLSRHARRLVAVRRAEAGQTGSISIGASLLLAAPILPLLLRRAMSARPDVRRTLVTGRPRELLDLVRWGELDITLVEQPPAEDGLRSIPVMDDPIVALLPTHHRLARREHLQLDDLDDEELINISRETSPTLHDRLVGLSAGSSPAIEVDDPGLVPILVAAAAGVALVPLSLAVASGLSGITWRPLDDAGPPVTLAAVAADEGATPQTMDFIELVCRLRNRGALQHGRNRHLALLPPVATPGGLGPATSSPTVVPIAAATAKSRRFSNSTA